MRNMFKLLLTLLAAFAAAGTADAGPQPMVLFKQKVRIGNNGGSLAGACGISNRDIPRPGDRYSSFKGEVVVTRYEPGKPPVSVPFDDAVNNHKWLEVPTGDGTTRHLHVRPRQAEPDVEYEVDIREPMPAVPNGDESAEIKDFLTKFGTNKSLVSQIDDLRKLAAELGDPTFDHSPGSGLQQLVWDLELGSERSAQDVERQVTELRAAMTRLAAEPEVQNFIRAAAAVREVMARSAVPELADVFGPQLQDATRIFVWRKADRERATATLRGLSDRIDRLVDSSDLKRFAADLRKLRDAAKTVPDATAQALIGVRAQTLLPTYLARPESATKQLAAIEKAVASLATDPSVKEFFARVAANREAVAKLPAVAVVGEEFADDLHDIQAAFIFGFGEDRVAAREDLTDLGARVVKLAGDEMLKRLAAQRDELVKALDALPRSSLVEAVQDGFDELIRGHAFSLKLDKAQGVALRRKLDALSESYAGLAVDADVRQFLTDATALQREVDAALPFTTSPGVDGKHDQMARAQFDSDLRDAVEGFVLLKAAGRASAREELASLQADVKQLEMVAARREAHRNPVVATVSHADDGSPLLQIGIGEKINLRTILPPPGQQVVCPEGWVGQTGKAVLVDVTELTVAQSQVVVETITAARQRGLDIDFCFQRSPDGKSNFQAMPNWERVRLLGDSTSLDKLPLRVRTSLIDWLKALAAEWEGEKMLRFNPNRVQLIVDHFDKDGASLRALEGRVRNDEFRDTYVLAVVCNSNPDSTAAFLSLADLAVKDGGAKMFCFPVEVMQAPVAPLVVESMMRLQRIPVTSPEELPIRACKDVRGRLERCVTMGDAEAVEQALRDEFPTRTGRNPADLFRNNSGDFKPEMLRIMIDFLKSAERGFITITLRKNLCATACG